MSPDRKKEPRCKVLFIENKHKTFFWDQIAFELEKAGVEIHWIVQNRLFLPRSGTKHVIPLPKREDLQHSEKYRSLENKDRHSYVYGNTPRHYEYYDRYISAILNEVSPSIVFGESTLFHEILAIGECKRRGILYLQPATCRYPKRRFSFYKNDSLEPYAGSGEIWDHESIEMTLSEIRSRRKLPDYMEKAKNIQKIRYHGRRAYGLWMSFLSAHVLGEKYNTPPISQKLGVEYVRRKVRKRYESIAVDCLVDELGYNTIVFPLQMQPEANIDVWGAPFNNQAALIRELAASLGSDWKVLVKPNPKSKYELTSELIESIEQNKNVIALSHNVPMERLFQRVKYYFSVTGTINHECLLSERVPFSPALDLLQKFFPEGYGIPTPESIKIAESRPLVDSLQVINYLVWSSYAGLIGDPIHAPAAFDNENINKVSQAFTAVIDQYLGESGASY